VYGKHGARFGLGRFLPWTRSEYVRHVHALKDVSFEISQGEVFGIMGHNGAGKSTLLACLSGISPHDSGVIEISGRIDALLQLGVGFHLGFTGRENVMMGSISMGMPVDEAREAVDAIIEFAELQNFADMPFFTYSSGMQARLQFAVAVHRAPDVLIIDEALSTGDGYFVNKSQRRIEEICASGSTVVLVSHNVRMIEGLCQNAMILERGRIIEIGRALQVSEKYRRMIIDFDYAGARKLYREHAGASFTDHGTGEIRIEEVKVTNEDPRATDDGCIHWNRAMCIRIRIHARERIESPRIVLQVHTLRQGTFATLITNQVVDPDSQELTHVDLGVLQGRHSIEFHIPHCPFAGNGYYVSVGFAPATPRRKLEDYDDYYVFRRVAATFQVRSFPEHPETVARALMVETMAKVEVK
jgi:ABC-type polysaccharide/polyol phosphate transport system ATPase subunit